MRAAGLACLCVTSAQIFSSVPQTFTTFGQVFTTLPSQALSTFPSTIVSQPFTTTTVTFGASIGGGVDPVPAGAVPLGDGHISSGAEVDYLDSCMKNFNGMMGGAQSTGSWVQGNVWYPSEKPAVQGSVPWPTANFSIVIQGSTRIIRSNGLPHHTTGIFPIQPTDPAYQYDRNPNSITAQNLYLPLPATPTEAVTPGCVPMGPIGLALTGSAIFNAVDGGGRDAVAHEIQDHCNGHPQQGGQYHYHGPSPCFPDVSGPAGQHSDLIGYIIDGYGIYGEYGDGGQVMTNDDLDGCHGHTHAVMWDGVLTTMYHYHVTAEYPYTVGCFHGNVPAGLENSLMAAGGGPGGGKGKGGKGMKGPPGQGGMMGGQGGMMGGPGGMGGGMGGPGMGGPGMGGMGGPMGGPMGMPPPPPPFGGFGR